MTDNRTTELESLSKLKMAGKLRFWRGAIEIPESELHAICNEIQAEHDRAVAATLGEQRSTVEIAELLDEFDSECFMLRVEASETRARDDVVRESYERILDEFAGRIAATVGSESNSDGLPAELTISDSGTLLNWRGENYVKQSALGNGTLTAEQVREAIERHSAWVIGNNRCFHDGAYEEIADELNAELGSGTCELDYDHHCSNCGVCVHERAVLVRKKLDGGLWTVVSKPASFCPNCGRRVKR